jgi:hypothetical protein
MPVDRLCDSDDRSGWTSRSFLRSGGRSPDGRCMMVDDARNIVAAKQAAIELLDLRADARKARDRRKQGIENVWPHARSRRIAMLACERWNGNHLC